MSLTAETCEESPIASDELKRRELLLEAEESMGIRVLGADIETTVLSAAKIEQIQTLSRAITYSNVSEEKEYYHMSVYEWTWVNYDYSKAGTEDVMGYATLHDIVLEKEGEVATVVSDGYEDPLYTGMTSSDYGVEYDDMVSAVEIYELDVASITGAENYNVNKAIEYADTYVRHAYLYNSSDNSYYNKRYSDKSGSKSDCCNFVSQCLAAGGLEETSGWHSKNWGESGTDYVSWTSIKYLTNYLEEEGYSIVSANASTIFPGNPVYYTTHIGICVGYNTAGVPILNAHTSDAYHIPYTRWSGNTLKTVLIATENLQINVPADAVDLGTISSSKSCTGSLSGQEADYYCFTPAKTGFYDIYTTGSVDTVGYICKSEVKNFDAIEDDEKTDNYDLTLFMYELSRDDDGGSNGNFSILEYLTAGETYYLKIVSFDDDTSGSYNLNIEWSMS